MPIKIDDQLPARHNLELENIFVMTEQRATHQDIRPLRIVILNLMPTKIETETQLSRLLGNTPLQVEIELIHTESFKILYPIARAMVTTVTLQKTGISRVICLTDVCHIPDGMPQDIGLQATLCVSIPVTSV